MRYVIFKIPIGRIVTRGGWDDFWYWTDDLADAKQLVDRDPAVATIYQIVDLLTGRVIAEVGHQHHTAPDEVSARMH